MATKYENYATGYDWDLPLVSGSPHAQTFTPSVTHYITKVILPLKKESGATGTLTISIRNTSGSVPTGSDLVSASIDVSTLGTSYGDVTFNFSSPIKLTSGTMYAIVLSSNSTSVYPYVKGDQSSPSYSGGAHCLYSSGWFTSAAYDLLFEEWGEVGLGGLFFCLG